MNDSDRHWLLERAARVLEPDVFAELEGALSRPVTVTSRNQSGEPDGSAISSRREAKPSEARAIEVGQEGSGRPGDDPAQTPPAQGLTHGEPRSAVVGTVAAEGSSATRGSRWPVLTETEMRWAHGDK